MPSEEGNLQLPEMCTSDFIYTYGDEFLLVLDP